MFVLFRHYLSIQGLVSELLYVVKDLLNEYCIQHAKQKAEKSQTLHSNQMFSFSFSVVILLTLKCF